MFAIFSILFASTLILVDNVSNIFNTIASKLILVDNVSNIFKCIFFQMLQGLRLSAVLNGKSEKLHLILFQLFNIFMLLNCYRNVSQGNFFTKLELFSKPFCSVD